MEDAYDFSRENSFVPARFPLSVDNPEVNTVSQPRTLITELNIHPREPSITDRKK